MDHLLQNAVGTESYAIGMLVGLKMNVGSPGFNGVQKHLVNETNDGRVVRVHVDVAVGAIVFVYRLNF